MHRDIRSFRKVALGLILAAHAGMLAWLDCQTSPNSSELGHMAAGLYSWHTGHFDVFATNPPLVRGIATAGVALCSPEYDWSDYSPLAQDRCEWSLGLAFLKANDADHARRYFTLARFSCMFWSLLGGWMVYQLGREIYGEAAGLCALTLWCFSSTILGWGATLCPDVAAAGLGVAAVRAFWLWLRFPSWRRALSAGLILGLAELCKFTLLVFYPLWLLLWLIHRLPQRSPRPAWGRETAAILAIVAVSLLVMDLGYGFEGCFQRLGDYPFQSQILSGAVSRPLVPGVEGNRFADTWLGRLPVPLPGNMVRGLDIQWLDFERGFPSYLQGEWADRGWWYYYLYAMAVKEPLGTWCLAAMALLLTDLGRGFSAGWREEVIVLAHFVAIVALASSRTGFSVHMRYVLPALPFLWIWASKAAQVLASPPSSGKQRAFAGMVLATIACSVSSSLTCYPHSLSYFNEIVGGPRHGGEHLLGSNFDWGQDLYYLRSWLDRHPDVVLTGLACWGAPATALGDACQTPLPFPAPAATDLGVDMRQREPGPRPGWYAISANHLFGRSRQYHYFLRLTPAAMIGYSIVVYHVTPDQAARLRREIGCARAPATW